MLLGVLLLLVLTSCILAKDPVHILYLTDCTKYSDWYVLIDSLDPWVTLLGPLNFSLILCYPGKLWVSLSRFGTAGKKDMRRGSCVALMKRRRNTIMICLS